MLKFYIIPAVLGTLHIGYILTSFVYGKNQKETQEEKNDEIELSVEHIVCFKNEARFIEKKLKNCYSIDYPHINNTFVNDNSTDNTLELLKEHRKKNTTIINNETDLGKNQSQIRAVKESKSDVILFTDANVFLEKDALRKLVRSFDENTGGLCGNVTITTDMKHQDMSGRYWQIEKSIKRFQSIFGTVIGFDGGFYCVKTKDYNVKRENELSDFETAFLLFEQQKKTTFVQDALATELEKRKLKASFMVRVRASNRAFCSFLRIFKYVDELSFSVLINFTLHKLIRYLFVITSILSLPFITIDFIRISPFLLLIFLIPQLSRLIIESIALCIGGVIALSGKEYTTWSQKKA